MDVAIRVDASEHIGTGHVMRCLCIGEHLLKMGARVRFICRSLQPHLRLLIQSAGIDVATTSAVLTRLEFKPETAWSDAAAFEDARWTLSCVREGCSWLIVDHYGATKAWESELRRRCRRIFAIDDIGRQHDCDVLLDQNLRGQADRTYVGKVPEQATQLLGPQYALLNAAFLEARKNAKPRSGEVKNLFICLGGADPTNVTEVVLSVLRSTGLKDIDVHVVVGSSHPARQRIESLCAMTSGWHCYVQTKNIAALLARADLAIGAGGSMTWERCALGVPSIGLCLADNQHDILANCHREGLLHFMDGRSVSQNGLLGAIRLVMDDERLRNNMSRKCLQTVDARGAERVAQTLFAHENR